MGRNSRWTSLMLCGGLVACLVTLPMKSRAEVGSQQQTAWPALAGENSGRVVDRQGQPVAAATVTLIADGVGKFQGTSNDEGTFPMPQTHGGGNWLFAWKEGFRFRGGFFENAEEVELVLTCDSDPPPRILKTLDPLLSHEERLALAAEVYLPVVDGVLKSDDNDGETIMALLTVALIDPGLTLELLQARFGLQKQTQDAIAAQVAAALFRDSPEESLAIVESMNEPYGRVRALTRLFSMLPAERTAQQQELAARILVHTHEVKEPPFRMRAYALALPCLRQAGLDDQVQQLLKQGQLLAQRLPDGGRFRDRSRNVFAVELALHHVDAALQLLAGLDDAYDHARFHGNVALRLATVCPETSQRVLDMIPLPQEPGQFNYRDHFAMQVCYWMAPGDQQRARDIAASTSGFQRGLAFAAMAWALAEQHPQQAEDMLRMSSGALEKHLEQQQQRGNVAAAIPLIAAAERIDPALVEEYMWRVISLMPAFGIEEDEYEIAAINRATLAMYIARYDRQLARKIVTPLMRLQTQRDATVRQIVSAAAMIDPTLAVQWLENLPDALKKDARSVIAELLARDDDELWNDQYVWRRSDLLW